jgi:hypothetical protein
LAVAFFFPDRTELAVETLLGLIVGVGLSAACGFRVFVPLLGMSVASMSGHLELSPGFEWIGTVPALIAFASATALEVGAYYVPWIDNLLDAAATPTAVAAGTVVTASMVGDVSPLLQWSLAAIAGGGAAGTVQFGTVALRGASSVTTGGFGNFMVSTMELIGAIVTTILAILLPILCLVVVAWMGYKLMQRAGKAAPGLSAAGVGTMPESSGRSSPPPPPASSR